MKNFRDFIFEQPAQEIAMSAREDDLWTARIVFYFGDQGSDAVVNAETFARAFRGSGS